MSEQAPNQAQFDTLAQAQQDAQGINPERIRYHEWVGNPGDENTSAAAGDLADYLKKRPHDAYEGTHIARHPLTDEHIDTDAYFDRKRNRHYNITEKNTPAHADVKIDEPQKAPEAPKGANDSRKEANQRNKQDKKTDQADQTSEAPKPKKPETQADKNKKAALDALIGGPEAQKVFAEGGEEAYLAYVKEKIDAANSTPEKPQTPAEADMELADALMDSTETGKGPKALEAGPQRKAIEAAPEQKAIEAGHQPKALEAGEIQIPEELREKLEQLDLSRDEFARMLAGRSGVTFFSRKFSEKKVDEAQEKYHQLRNEAGGEIARIMRETGYSDEQISQFAVSASILESKSLTANVLEHRIEMSEGKRLKTFYDKWASWGGNKFFSREGFKGNTKKSLTMAGITLVPGLAIGVAGAAVFGPALAAVAGVAAAKGIGRALGGAKINKEANAATVAQKQAEAMDSRMLDGHIEAGNQETILSAEEIAQAAREKVDSWKHRNDRRAAAGVVIGLAAGAAGAALGSVIHDGISGGGKSVPRGVPKVTQETPAPAPVPEHVDLVVTDTRFPWTHMTERIGSNGTPKILDLVGKGQAHGWLINGNGQGGGSGAIESIVTPDGQNIPGSDLGRVNAALDYIDTHYN